MIQSHVFLFFAIALFLAVCPCAEATGGTANSKDKAEEDVNALQGLTKQVLSTAESNAREAENTKSTVEDQKTKTVNAESDVRTAAAAITAKERKTQADAIVRTAAGELGNCDKLYDDAKEKAEKASKSLNGFVASAKELVQSAQIEIPDVSNPPEDYTTVIQNAADVTDRTTKLNQDIGKSTDLTTAKIALSALKEGAKKVQVLKYQAESLIVVSNIETKMSEAETDIQSVQRKENEIDAIATEMNEKLKSAPDALSSVLSSLCSTADSQLRTATKKVKEAQQCKQTILDRKKQVDGTLQTLMARTDEETEAREDARTVEWHAKDIDGEIAKIKAALGAAENAFSSAQIVQQQMQGEISQKKSQSASGVNNEKPQDNARTEEVTNTIQNGAAKNPAITERDQNALEKSKDTMEKTSVQPVNTLLDKTEQNKSTQLTDQHTQNPKDDKSELLNNNKLRNITKNITNNPLIGGEVPTRSAANDSAVTVFIPLLVILVISAVLH